MRPSVGFYFFLFQLCLFLEAAVCLATDSDKNPLQQQSAATNPFVRQYEYREWSDATKTFSTSAHFSHLDDEESAVLIKEDKTQVVVPIEKLSTPDQVFIRNRTAKNPFENPREFHEWKDKTLKHSVVGYFVKLSENKNKVFIGDNKQGLFVIDLSELCPADVRLIEKSSPDLNVQDNARKKNSFWLEIDFPIEAPSDPTAISDFTELVKKIDQGKKVLLNSSDVRRYEAGTGLAATPTVKTIPGTVYTTQCWYDIIDVVHMHRGLLVKETNARNVANNILKQVNATSRQLAAISNNKRQAQMAGVSFNDGLLTNCQQQLNALNSQLQTARSSLGKVQQDFQTVNSKLAPALTAMLQNYQLASIILYRSNTEQRNIMTEALENTKALPNGFASTLLYITAISQKPSDNGLIEIEGQLRQIRNIFVENPLLAESEFCVDYSLLAISVGLDEEVAEAIRYLTKSRSIRGQPKFDYLVSLQYQQDQRYESAKRKLRASLNKCKERHLRSLIAADAAYCELLDDPNAKPEAIEGYVNELAETISSEPSLARWQHYRCLALYELHFGDREVAAKLARLYLKDVPNGFINDAKSLCAKCGSEDE